MNLGTCGHMLDHASTLVGATTCTDCERNRLVSIGRRLATEGMKRAAEAHPEDAAKVLAAISQLAATGRPFSANDVRPIHGVSGPVVGAAFTTAKKAGVIKRHGREFTPSDDGPTHGHPIAVWIGAAS